MYTPPPPPICTDADGDGWCADEDCDDADPFRHSDCIERCVRQQCPPLWHWDWDNCMCMMGEYCPVVVDTEGDGFRLTGGPGGVRFDLDADGTPERLSWTSAGSDDSWLALDRNGNGAVDDGTELFGNYTPQPPAERPHGFLALAEYDRAERGGNADGVIDKSDAVFAALRLWRDANHDGVSEAGELHSLKQLGLKSISLDYKESKRVDRHGNEFRYRAKVKDVRDAQLGRWAWDVFLAAAP